METNAVELKILILSILFIIPVELLAMLIAADNGYFSVELLGVVRVIETGLIILVVMIWGKGVSSIGLNPLKMLAGVKRGLIWSAVIGLITAAFFVLFFADSNMTLIILQMKSNLY